MGDEAPSAPDVAELNAFFDSLPSVLDLERARKESVNGTIRFDVNGCEPWHVSLFGGRVTITRKRARADTVVEASDELSCGCYAVSRTRDGDAQAARPDRALP